MQRTASGLEQLYSIQILRALAAGSVVWLHTATQPSFGQFGVDLFFVISGFVMCLLIDHTKPSGGAFLKGRFSRIVPLYWTVTTMVLLVAYFAPSLMGMTLANFDNYILSLLFIPHLREDGHMFPMLMPGWSLNYEMWFYALIGETLVINARRWKSTVAVCLVAVWWMSDFLDPTRVSYKFLHNTLWLEFILGMSAYQIYRHRLMQRLPVALALVLVIVAYVAMAFLEMTTHVDQLYIGGIPSFFMLLCALRLEGAIRRLQSAVLKAIVHMGDASYATYLSHMFAVEFIERILFVRMHIAKSLGTSLFTVACSLIVGSILYRLVDRPASRLVRRRLMARQEINHTGLGSLGAHSQ